MPIELDFLTSWENILFTIPLALFFVILLTQLIGLGDSWIDGVGLDFDFLGDGAKIGILSFFIMPFLGVFATTGLTATYLMRENTVYSSPTTMFCLALLVSLVSSVQLSFWVHKIATRFLRDVESHAFEPENLVGKCGKVIATQRNNKSAVLNVTVPKLGTCKVSVLLGSGVTRVETGDEMRIIKFDKGQGQCICVHDASVHLSGAELEPRDE